jgi:hypothetical protein
LLELEDASLPLPPRVINRRDVEASVHALLGSVVRHSKIGPSMTLWVKSALERQREPTGHVRFAPKADKQADVSLSPLCANSDLTRRSTAFFDDASADDFRLGAIGH